MSNASDAVRTVWRHEAPQIIASLTRMTRDLALAEDAAQDALVAALEQWPGGGIPDNPAAWLMTTAKRRAVDTMRRAATLRQKASELTAREEEAVPDLDDQVDHIADDVLRLMFLCCHPALAADAQVALTLRLLGGLETPEIARAFLVPEATVAQRLVRAKRKLRANHAPYRVPSNAELPARLHAVLAAVSLIFTEGHTASSGDSLTRTDLSAEAIRLGRVLTELMPDEPEAVGLLALMLLTESRRDARVAGDELVTLDEQDRGSWNHELIAEGHALVRECLARVAAGGPAPGTYQLMAAINAVHADASDARATDWSQIAQLYDQLYAVAPTPIVAMNRAIVIAELDGPDVALSVVESLALEGYHAWHATRADLLRRLGRSAEARSAYESAIAATENTAEKAYLSRRRDQLSPPG